MHRATTKKYKGLALHTGCYVSPVSGDRHINSTIGMSASTQEIVNFALIVMI